MNRNVAHKTGDCEVPKF